MMTINNSNNPTGNEPANDETYMRRAIELAALGRFTTSPNQCGMRDCERREDYR